MDNQSISYTSRGEKALSLGIKAIVNSQPNGIWDKKATHYHVVKMTSHCGHYGLNVNYTDTTEDKDKVPTLIISWYEAKVAGESQLLYPHDSDQMVSLINGWLNTVAYPPEPNIDGDCKKGFHMFTDFWGHGAGIHGAIVAIQPTWAMFGK